MISARDCPAGPSCRLCDQSVPRDSVEWRCYRCGILAAVADVGPIAPRVPLGVWFRCGTAHRHNVQSYCRPCRAAAARGKKRNLWVGEMRRSRSATKARDERHAQFLHAQIDNAVNLLALAAAPDEGLIRGLSVTRNNISALLKELKRESGEAEGATRG